MFPNSNFATGGLFLPPAALFPHLSSVQSSVSTSMQQHHTTDVMTSATNNPFLQLPYKSPYWLAAAAAAAAAASGSTSGNDPPSHGSQILSALASTAASLRHSDRQEHFHPPVDSDKSPMSSPGNTFEQRVDQNLAMNRNSHFSPRMMPTLSGANSPQMAKEELDVVTIKGD